MNAFDTFLSAYPLVTYEKGQVILLKDEVPKGVYIIASGLVKTYTINASGEERLISIDSKGEDIPVGFTAGLIVKSHYFYEAYRRCTIRVVPTEAYLRHLVENSDSLLRRHVRITKMLLSSLSRIEALEQSSASDKVAYTLMYIADKIGGKFLSKKARFNLSITQQEVANALGVTRETAGIVLKKLETKKLLAHSRNSYVLHMKRLRTYLSRH